MPHDIQYNGQGLSNLAYTDTFIDAIDEATPELKLTHNPKTKGKGEEPYVLKLEPVPALSVSAKPRKTGDSDFTRAASASSNSSSPFALGSPVIKRPLAQRHSVLEDTISDTAVDEESPSKPAPATPAESIPAIPKTSASASTTPVHLAVALKRPAPTSDPAPDSKRSRPPTLTETRRQISLMKSRRAQVAKKRIELDVQLEPYKERLREERERLLKELAEETQAWKEESIALKDDSTMLAEFKREESAEQIATRE